jgi:two-component system cell cycle sensor histidine kinase/response regulator CckA
LPTVLVVDDHESIRKLLAMSLETVGFSVLLAGSGPEALSIARSHKGRLDLLLTDLDMPGMDGVSLVLHLRTELPALPVIVMSGSWDPAIAHIPGPTRFISKPFSIGSVAATLRELALHSGTNQADAYPAAAVR